MDKLSVSDHDTLARHNYQVVGLARSCSRSQFFWASLIQNCLWHSVSLVVNGPLIRSVPRLRSALWANRRIQAQTLTAFCNGNFCNTLSISLPSSTATVNICFTALASALLSGVGSNYVTMSFGQSSVLESHSGPYHHNFALST